jgi:hydroxypyruvate isomerase
MSTRVTRRSALTQLTAGATAVAATAQIGKRLGAAEAALGGLKGRVNHSVCRWCYKNVPTEDLCKAGRDMGLHSVELLDPPDFPVVKKYGLTCAMVSFPVVDGIGGITKAFNRVEHHDRLVKGYEERIKAAAEAGMKNVICFSGNRAGLDDEQGLENCAIGLKRVLPFAEKHNIVLAMELLNSRVNHKDYMCDRSKWGIELCKRIGSERFKLLYDIYHMQIMEGDVIATIRANHSYFVHYHTGGVPGRAEIDDTQELNYAAIMRAILETGFKGFVAQEFVPQRKDVLASLRQGVQICDV